MYKLFISQRQYCVQTTHYSTANLGYILNVHNELPLYSAFYQFIHNFILNFKHLFTLLFCFYARKTQDLLLLLLLNI